MTRADPSLQRRLVLAVVGIASGVVLVASGGAWWTTHVVLRNGIDRELVERGQRMQRWDAIPINGRFQRFEERLRNDPHRIVQALTGGGVEVGRSGGVTPGELLWHGEQAVLDGRPHTVDSGKRRIRVVVLPCSRLPPMLERLSDPPEGSSLVMVAGIDLTQLEEESSRLATMLAVLWLVATALATSAALVLRRTILRPLSTLSEELARLRPEDLSARVPSSGAPIELQSVIARLNQLLGDMEQAMQREQATISYLAHELRTPVAELRTAIEFRLLAAPADDERELLEGLLDTVLRMQEMTSNLLLLARLESGRQAIPSEPVPLQPLLEEAVDRWQPHADRRQQTFSIACPDEAMITIVPAQFDLAIDNLLGNAVAHGSAAGAISISAGLVAGRIEIAVSNPYLGNVDTDALGHLFQRGDQARTANGHAGLGLALCRRILRLYGGTLNLAGEHRRFTATMSIPAAPSHP